MSIDYRRDGQPAVFDENGKAYTARALCQMLVGVRQAMYLARELGHYDDAEVLLVKLKIGRSLLRTLETMARD